MADYARGELLRRLREDRHLSQENAAHEIGVSAKTLRTWEHGGPIKWENAQLAADFYEVDAESLVSRTLTEDGAEPLTEVVARLERIEQMLIALFVDEVEAEVGAAQGTTQAPRRRRAKRG